MNPFLHAPVYCFGIPMLLALATYTTASIWMELSISGFSFTRYKDFVMIIPELQWTPRSCNHGVARTVASIVEQLICFQVTSFLSERMELIFGSVLHIYIKYLNLYTNSFDMNIFSYLSKKYYILFLGLTLKNIFLLFIQKLFLLKKLFQTKILFKIDYIIW